MTAKIRFSVSKLGIFDLSYLFLVALDNFGFFNEKNRKKHCKDYKNVKIITFTHFQGNQHPGMH